MRLQRCWWFGVATSLVGACSGGERFTSATDASATQTGGTGGTGGAGTDGSAGAAGAGGSAGAAGAGGGASGGASAGASGAPPRDAGGDASPDAAAGASGSATDASDSPACEDRDQDGHTTCAGDCDDDDPLSHPAGRERCGDLADNDCDGATDEGCNGVGTYVSTTTGDDTFPGTKTQPVKTVTRGIQNAIAAGGNREVFVAEGHYVEKILLVEGVDLTGGHQCSPTSCDWSRDPAAYVSVLEAVDAEGLSADATITRSTSVEGFTIVGLDGASGGPLGRAAVSLVGGSPRLLFNTIQGPATTSSDWQTGRSTAIAIHAPTTAAGGPELRGNTIQGGTASAASSAALLIDTPAYPSSGFATALIVDNTILGGTGTNVSAVAAWQSGPGTILQRNSIEAGSATAGSAFAVRFAGTLDLDANTINLGSGATCTAAGWCGGIESESGTGTLTNNVVLGAASTRSAAVVLAEMERPTGLIGFSSNTLDGAGTATNNTVSAALVLQIGSCASCGFAGQVGQVRSNIFLAGRAAQRFGVYEDAPAGKQQHPLLLENNLFWLGGSTSVPGAALYRAWDGAAQILVTTAAGVNGLGAFFPFTASANLFSDPLLDASHRLAAGSPAIDAGSTVNAPPTDRDGQPRPNGGGYDIGADER
ncbi:MAG: DUF1565 domain-containing protein [Polyangiaceae bacterium]|nr:DUF1565 domain-containing protein [Polyangiaceae bacterium]